MSETLTLSQLAVTVMIGMGVVFSALLGLSIYIGIFKRLTAKFEAGTEARRTAVKAAPAPAPPEAGAEPDGADDEDAYAAAVIAVSLHLDGALGGVPAETVVAITTALELERRRRFAMASKEADVSWRLAGRARAMGALQRGQDMRGAWTRSGSAR